MAKKQPPKPPPKKPASKKPPKKPPSAKAGQAAAKLANLPAKANSPANYAVIAMHNMLVMYGQAARDEGKQIVYSFGSTDVATLELVPLRGGSALGDELVVEFLGPSNLDIAIRGPTTLRDLLKNFETVAGRKDWLRYRRPATRDPRRDLETGIGPMIGQAFRQYLGMSPGQLPPAIAKAKT